MARNVKTAERLLKFSKKEDDPSANHYVILRKKAITKKRISLFLLTQTCIFIGGTQKRFKLLIISWNYQ